MPWTEITRSHHDRSELRYASDCRDEEWESIAPIVTLRNKVGRPGTVVTHPPAIRPQRC